MNTILSTLIILALAVAIFFDKLRAVEAQHKLQSASEYSELARMTTYGAQELQKGRLKT